MTVSVDAPMNRREFLKITAVSGALLVGGGILRYGIKPEPVVVQETRSLMGTVINLTIVTNELATGQSALEGTFSEMQRLVTIFDHRGVDNDLARLNRNGRLKSPPVELVLLLDQAIELGNLTEGAFDISVKPLLSSIQTGIPELADAQALVDYRRILLGGDEIKLEPDMAITLDGIAKGSVVDAGINNLRDYGFDNVLVEAGGDLVGNGRSPKGKPWRVGIAHPRSISSSQLITTLPVTSQAVATSGDYMNSFSTDFNLHHIIDPRTGMSPPDSASVTVLAPTATMADALSTALMVMGPDKGLALVNRLPGVEAMFVSKALQLYYSTGFPSEQ